MPTSITASVRASVQDLATIAQHMHDSGTLERRGLSAVISQIVRTYAHSLELEGAQTPANDGEAIDTLIMLGFPSTQLMGGRAGVSKKMANSMSAVSRSQMDAVNRILDAQQSEGEDK